jgi:hypothetical protein
VAGFAFDALFRRKRSENSAQQENGVRLLQRALLALGAALLTLTTFLVAVPPTARRWIDMAHGRAENPVSEAVALEIASQWRTTAILETLIALVIATICVVFLGRWLRSRGPERRRAQTILLAVVVLDVLLLSWKSAWVVTPHDLASRVTWPGDITQRYQPSQRWMTHVPWDAFNINIARGIDTFDGYDALGSKRYYKFVSAIEGFDLWAAMYQPIRYDPLLRVAGVTHLFSSVRTPPTVLDGRVVLHPVARSGNRTLWRFDGAWPRVYLSRDIRRTPAEQQLQTLGVLSRASYAPGRYPVVAPPDAFAAVPSVPVSAAERVLDWLRTENTMTTMVQTSAPAVLVQSEALGPGWRAWVNGRPVPLNEANYLFRAVQVPAGRSRVDVVYDWQTFRFGGFLSLCGLGCVALLMASAASRRRSADAQRQSRLNARDRTWNARVAGTASKRVWLRRIVLAAPATHCLPLIYNGSDSVFMPQLPLFLWLLRFPSSSRLTTAN